MAATAMATMISADNSGGGEEEEEEAVVVVEEVKVEIGSAVGNGTGGQLSVGVCTTFAHFLTDN